MDGFLQDCDFSDDDVSDDSEGFNVRADLRPMELEDYDCASRPIYHPIFAKRWMDHRKYKDETDPDDLDWSRMQDTVAFIGNSIAFHMGSSRHIDATSWDSPDPDTFTMHKLTVPFEVRSARGVLTLAEVYHGIQGAIWMNHTWACGHVFFEGIREVHDYREEQPTPYPPYKGQPTLAEATRWGST